MSFAFEKGLDVRITRDSFLRDANVIVRLEL